MIVFNNSVVEDIINTIGRCNNESGGLLGSTNNLEITEYFFDKESSLNEYVPDVDKLNKVLTEWTYKNICFVGIIHSHVTKKDLSTADIIYARSILSINNLERIIMPIMVLFSMRLYVYIVTPRDVCLDSCLSLFE